MLDTHKSYYNQLNRHYLNEISIIDEKADQELQIEKDSDRRKAIKENREKSKNMLTSKFEETVQVVCDVYEKHLKDNIPKPAAMQAKLKVRILRKNYKFDGLVLKPTDE